LILIDGERYFLQPARSISKSAQADEFVFYRASDVIVDSGECGVTLAAQADAQHDRTFADIKALLAAATSGLPPVSPLSVVRLATDADAEYVAALGSAAAANSQIMSIMNQVDAIYQVELGLTFQIVLQNSWTDAATDPYTTTAPSSLLAEFRTYWNANFTSVQRSMAHLWTGKDLDGTTIGIAHVGSVCLVPTSSYGVSQLFPMTGSNAITIQTVSLTAHEMGHSFSARHPNQATTEIPIDVAAACRDTIMESSIGDGGSFCAYSRHQITGFENANESCLINTSAPSPVFSPCAAIPAMVNAPSQSGRLTNSDCQSPSRGVSFYADRYWFDGVEGQTLTLLMNKSLVGLDPYIYVIGPNGYVLSQDDDGNSSQNSRLEFTLPVSGRYLVEATSFGVQQTGDYTLITRLSSCSISVNPTSVLFPAAGGSGSLNVTGNCSYDFRAHVDLNQGAWLGNQTTGGSGTQTLNYNVLNNTNTAGRTGFLVVGCDNTGRGGLRIPVIQSGAGPDCSLIPIAIGQTVSGSLSTGNCQSPIRGNAYFSTRYSFAAQAGEQVSIGLSSPTFDTFLTLIGPDGAILFNDDDSGGGTNSRIPGSGVLTLAIPGTYIVEVNGFNTNAFGPYSLTLLPPQATVQLNSATFTVSESAGALQLSLSRNGDTSNSASVDFVTLGQSYVNCSIAEGTALQNCDYTIGAGTLRFAPGEASKALTILINDDTYVEGDEAFALQLSNPLGASVGPVNAATVIVQDNDSGTPSGNPLDTARFFVRQHYYDFLSRLPDSGGLDFWSFQIDVCGTDPNCLHARRVDVSNAFFYELEFQRTAAYVFRLYRAAYGDNQPFPNPDPSNPVEARKIPAYSVFVRDRAAVVDGPDLAQQQLALATVMTSRPEFITRYPINSTAAQFADALLGTIQTASGVSLASQRDSLITLFNESGRGAVLYRLADDNVQSNPINNRSFVDAEYNRSFVFGEYSGYLRRDSDIGGFLFWLDQVNRFPVRDANIQHTMVCAFITSTEYQQRFSSLVTRNNSQCN
jgi:hypothetical protein